MARHRYFRTILSSASVLAIGIGLPVTAVAQEADDEQVELDTVYVTGSSRISDDLSSVPGTVKVIGSDAIETQSLFSNDLGDILAREIPGYGVSSSASYSNFSQTMRGRKPAVFIDGIPTTVPLRDGGRDLRLISPAAIGQVEVISGSTSLFGLGGAGGLINYSTKEPGSGPAEFQTDISAGMSLTNPSDSLSYTLQQSGTGRSGPVSFVFSGFYESYGTFFDAKGDAIPPDPQGQGGLADTDAYNLFGKLGFDIAPGQAIYLSANYYEIEQDTDQVPSGGDFGNRPAIGVDGSPPGENQTTENLIASVRYVNEDVLGSEVNLQAYYSDYETIFAFSLPPVYPPDGGQSIIDAERAGIRFDVNTPVTLGGRESNILWGVDYTTDETSQPLVDGRLLVPVLEQTSIAPFVQVQLDLSDMLNVVGGVRFENAEVEAPTFTTIPFFDNPCCLGGNTVQGGTLDYDETLFNIGAVLSPFSSGTFAGTDFYAGFSQGFTVNDFGRALRATSVGSIEEFAFEAQVIDSYEIGVRSDFGDVQTTLVGFFNESELGSSFNAATLELVRAPEEVWGFEFSLDAQPSDDWRWGSSVAWVDGETTNASGVTSELDTSRISPLKATAYLEHDFSNGWSARGQVTHSGRQQRFENQQVFGRADVESFTLVDASVSGEVGPGRLTVAISNLLNAYYFTPDAFRFAGDSTFTTGAGAAARVTYSIKY